MPRRDTAAAAARAALAAVFAQDKGAIPAPNEHEPRRVTAHLGEFRAEAEFMPGRADSMLTIDHNGAPVLKAHVEPVWQGQRRRDKIEIQELHGTDWCRDLLAYAPRPARADRATPSRKRKAARARPAKKGKRKAPSAPRRQTKRRRAKRAAPGRHRPSRRAAPRGRA